MIMMNPLVVSNNIIDRAFSENIVVTPMKLQRLLYCIYREYLQKTRVPLFAERFETWK